MHKSRSIGGDELVRLHNYSSEGKIVLAPLSGICLSGLRMLYYINLKRTCRERSLPMTAISAMIASAQPVAAVIISVALMLFFGFAMTRITKLLRLPNVTAYIVAGILLGPYCLGLVPQRIIDGMDFLSDVALAFIAFSTGEFFKLSVLKKNGWKVVWITVLEATLASVLVFVLTFWVLRLPLSFSVVLAALASATAPASTMMTIRQTGAKGDFVNTLLQVVALDDVVGLVLYSVAISVALAAQSGGGHGFSFETLVLPLLTNLGVLALGGVFGLLMKLLMPQKRSTDNKLIIAIALLFTFCGVCALLGISPLLGCMAMGTVYTNVAEDDKLFKQLNYFSPPILLLFFVRSGMSFRLDTLFSTSAAGLGVPLLAVGVIVYGYVNDRRAKQMQAELMEEVSQSAAAGEAAAESVAE